MSLITKLETDCPACGWTIELTDFDPEDLEQEIECGNCHFVFDEWEFADGVLTLLLESDDDEDDEPITGEPPDEEDLEDAEDEEDDSE